MANTRTDHTRIMLEFSTPSLALLAEKAAGVAVVELQWRPHVAMGSCGTCWADANDLPLGWAGRSEWYI